MPGLEITEHALRCGGGPIFSLNGRLVKAGTRANISLSDYIREYTKLKGPKIACGEGGCGVCAVLATTYNPETDETKSTSLNACLAPLGTLDGVAITTVEALGNAREGFSPVQEAFAQHHASQCGYCTPGFVVACHGTLAKAGQSGCRPSPEEVMQALDGNLCRCTGYQPIMDACKTVVEMEDLCPKRAGLLPFPQALKERVKARRNLALSSVPDVTPSDGTPVWLSPVDMASCHRCLTQLQGTEFQLVAGNTASGVYHEWPSAKTIVNIKCVKEFNIIDRSEGGLVFGAAVPFSAMIEELTSSSADKPVPAAYLAIAAHLSRIAGTHVRSVATSGGNLSLLVNPEYRLESDFATVLMGAGGSVGLTHGNSIRWISMDQFLKEYYSEGLNGGVLISGVRFPRCEEGYTYWSQKVANRFYNAHSLINLALSYQRTSTGALRNVKIAIGCPSLHGQHSGGKVVWELRAATKAAQTLEASIPNAETLVDCLNAFHEDFHPASNQAGSESFYRSAAEGLLFQGLSHLLSSQDKAGSMPALLKASPLAPPSVPQGRQFFPPAPKKQHPVGLPIEKDRIRLQASGEAVYTSDIVTGDHLHASLVASTQPLAAIKHIDASAALELEGVHAFVGAADVPGKNKMFLGGGLVEFFASEETVYSGQPLGVIVADSQRLARQASALVRVTYSTPKDGKKPILSLEDGIAAESFIGYPDRSSGSNKIGDPQTAMQNAEHTIHNAQYCVPSQQHFYMETQTAVAAPQEGGAMLIHSSTQSLDWVQSAVATALGRPANDIIAVCRRVGGGFGGKVTRSVPPAVTAAVAANKLQQPVSYQLNRNEDMRMNGGRAELKMEYDVGFDGEGRISALVIRAWFLSGAELDLAWMDSMSLRGSPDEVYGIPNIQVDIKLVRTNLPPRTAVRAPSHPQCVLVMEEVVERVANYLGKDPALVRELNFHKEPHIQPPVAESQHPDDRNGLEPSQTKKHKVDDTRRVVTCHESLNSPTQGEVRKTLCKPIKAEFWTLPRVWKDLQESSDFHARRQAIQEFNKRSVWHKRGISITPSRYDFNPQASSAVVNIYYDGTILVSHAGLEIGQGLSTKVKQAAIYELSNLLPAHLRPLPTHLIRINDSRTDITPSSGGTFASTASESACAAVVDACKQLIKSLRPKAEAVNEVDSPEGFWKAAIAKALNPMMVGIMPSNVPLSAHGWFDGTETGGKERMSYTSFGSAVTEVEIDVLTGDRRILRCDIHFDCGTSLNPMIDMGQVEGAFVQGLGMMTSEEVIVDETSGRLLTDSTWNYKIPSIACIPQQLHVSFLKDSPNPRGVLGSKASGEPSLILSSSVLFALRNAVQAARDGLADLRHSSSKWEDDETSTTSEPSDDIESNRGRYLSHLHQREHFAFDAPATVVKIKQACGSFSVASILQTMLDSAADTDSSSDCNSTWTKI